MRPMVWSGFVEPNNTRAIVYDDGTVLVRCDNPTDAQRVAALSMAVALLASVACSPLDITTGEGALRALREVGR